MKLKLDKQLMPLLRMCNVRGAVFALSKHQSFIWNQPSGCYRSSINVDDETASLLNYAVTCYEQSDGLFDITSGILRRAWKFDQDKLPEQSLIDGLIDKVGWHKVVWKRPILTFTVPGMEIDLGGVVKEYAVIVLQVYVLGKGSNMVSLIWRWH